MGVEAERAYVARRPGENPPPGTSRLYFGAEFCFRALPPASDIRRALRTARDAGCAFTLMIPVLSERCLSPLEDLLSDLAPLLDEQAEIMISDLGAIDLVRDRLPSIPLLLGRSLSGQKRGARILDFSLSPAQRDYFRQGRWYAEEAVAFLRERGIRRLEIDNLLQGVAPVPTGFAGSLHVPYAMVTSSRNCPHRPGHKGGCAVACQEVFTLSTPESAVPLFQAGNTQFLRNESLPDDLPSLGIDRLVFHPHLPR